MFQAIKGLYDRITGEVDEEKLYRSEYDDISESDKDLVERINRRIQMMKDHRSNSCPEAYFSNVLTKEGRLEDTIIGSNQSETQSVNYDWLERWKRDYDLYSMRTAKNTLDPDLNEVSSPLVYSTVEAIMGQSQDANTTATFDANDTEKDTIARIAEFWLINWEKKTNAQQNIKEPSLREMLICGTSITYNYYAEKKRVVKKMLSEEDAIIETLQKTIDPALFAADRDAILNNPQNYMSDEQVQQIKDDIKKNPQKYLTKEEVIVDYQDFYIEHVPIEQFFVDPTAMNLNGIANDARDCAWIQNTNADELRKVYAMSTDPFVKKGNLKQALQHKRVNDSDEDEINRVNDLDKNYDIRVVKYYNKYDDQYIIIANGVVIRRGPLPFNHKKLPFSVARCTHVKNSFYGVGIATLLDNLQTRDEAFKSQQDYITNYNANLPGTYVDSTGDLEGQLTKISEDEKTLKAGQLIKIGQGDSFDRMLPIPDNGDIQRRRQEIDEDATKISMVSPLLVNQFKNNMAVRNNQMQQENSLVGIRMIINNFAAQYRESIKQGLSILKQTGSYTFSEAEEDITRNMVKLEGYAMNDDRQLEEIEGSSMIQMDKTMLDQLDELDVNVTIETSALASKAQQAQELADVMNLALAVFSNPALSENKIIMTLVKDLFQKKNFNPKIINMFKQDDSEDAELFAEYQNRNMLEGQNEPGIPGMSENHNMVHAQLLIDLMSERYGIMNDPTQQERVMEIDKIIETLNQHLATDHVQTYQTTETALTIAQAAQQPPQMQGMPAEPMQAEPMSQQQEMIPITPDTGT